MKRLFAILLILDRFAFPLQAAEPTTTPILRIEAGMHTAPIRKICTDAAGRLVLTVSQDKTARLSELSSGRLLRVLRPPLGEGEEGKLYAGALSPDGTIAAVGGWTGYEWDKSLYISLFDTTTGRLLRRLGGLPNVISDLAFSVGGRFLAAGLGRGGIGFWDTATGRLLGQDADYGDTCHGLDWHGDEHLATSCDDGQVRLYQAGEKGLHLLRMVPTDKGRRPRAVRFSPDGTRLAVSFNDARSVEVRDGGDLSLLFCPNTAEVVDGNLATIAWSADGQTLAAGGMWGEDAPNGFFPIRVWNKSGRGRVHDVWAAKNSIMDLRPLPEGGFVFGEAEPAWGTVSGDRSPKVTFKGASPIADYRANWEGFRLAADATVVEFGFHFFGKIPATFSFPERRLSLLEGASAKLLPSLHPPRLNGLPIADWKYSYVPKIRNQPLTLEQHEMSRSLAIAPDASFFLLGTEWFLRRFSAQGQERWKILVPGVVWAVNLSIDGNLAVAAYADGTIRWYRADNGKELLAFFPHADRRRWVLWTPEGYYDCSPGAEDLIGWHVNLAKDQAADFFPAARFRAIYYRPDVVSRVLKTMDTTEALRRANAALGKPHTSSESIAEVIARLSPPVVELATGGVLGTVNVPADADHVNVRYRVRNTGKEHAIRVDIRLNGRPLEVAAPLPAEDKESEVSVPLPDGLEGDLSIIASHKLSSSEAAILRVKREGGHPLNARKPDLYVVSVGVAHLKMSEGLDTNGDGVISDEEINAKYSKGALFFDDLHNAASDARRIGDLFQKQQSMLFGRVIPRVLVDKEATTATVRDALGAVARESKAGDVVLFFFSGHGYTDAKTPFFLATHDTEAEHAAATALTGQELTQLLGKIKGSVVLFLDTCHSGAALGKLKDEKVIVGPEDLTGFVNTLSSSEQGVVVLSSSSETEESFESRTQGYFTQALIEGVKGGAGKEGTVSCETLQDFITRRVPELVSQNQTIKVEGRTQTPSCIMPKGVPDFPLALTPFAPSAH